jgi:HEAT repeat protein
MIKACAHRNLSIRSAAASEFAKMRERPEGVRLAAVAVPAMVNLLSDADPVVRGIALDFFGASGPEARAVSPRLRELVGDEDATIRAKAIRTVGKIHGVEKQEIERLQALAADSDTAVRKEVKAGLEKLIGSGE